MEKSYNIPNPEKLPLEIEFLPEHARTGPNGSYSQTALRVCLPKYLVDLLIKLAMNQNELIDRSTELTQKVDRIYNSRIGKSILAFGEDKEK